MGYPLELAVRYLGSKKRGSISVGTAFAILGVALGVAALATVMSVTGGFQAQFRDKVLGVNAHVLVLKYSTDFREYRKIEEQVAKTPGVIGVAPFSINPMMLTHGDATATGVLLKGVDPAQSLGVDAPPGTVPVLHLPQDLLSRERLLREGLCDPNACNPTLEGLRLPDAKPAPRKASASPWGDDEILDAGVPEKDIDEYDDAGRNVGKIKLFEDDLNKRLEQRARDDGPAHADDALDAGAPEKKAASDADAATQLAKDAPRGDVEPDGGYKSKLPSADDDLPSDVDPDPCSNPAEIAKMPGIVVGASLAKTLDLKLGQCVTVTSPTIGYSYSGGQIKPPVAKRFRVIAMFEAGFDQYDSKLVYTDLYQSQEFYDQGDTVTGIEMKVADIDDAPRISKEIGDQLASGLYHTMDWEELNHGLFTALAIQQWAMSTVLALIIVVAAFTVIATLIMVVLDKKREISVLKAMGARDDAVLRIFMYQGGIIGLVGTTAGLLLGLFVCKIVLIYLLPIKLDPKVYFISQLPVLVRPQEFALTGAIALLICLFATIVPSLYAANLRPAEGFREQ